MTGTRDWASLAVLSLMFVLHFVASPAGEPWKNSDETRHVMTGVFVHDAILEAPESLTDPRGYAERYYVARPALGLLVWPPLFYGCEGLVMLLLGPSYFAARLTLSVFAIWAFFETRKLYRNTIGGEFATVALALCACTPMIVDYSRFVMLELPTLTFVLAAANRFEDYLATHRGRAAILACVFAACAALTRFDGVVVGTYFGMRLIATRNWAVLLNRPVVFGVVIALIMTVPYYAMTAYYYSGGVAAAAATGTGADATGYLAVANFWLYPAYVPRQVGGLVTIAALLGLPRGGPFAAMIAATYLTFVPLAEPDARHAIYWVPAICGLAALAIKRLTESRSRPWASRAAFLVVLTTGWQATREPALYIVGYARAAQYVVEHRTDSRPILFDGVLTGGFIYQVHLLDPERTIPVLRGDKLLYAVMSDPHGGYVEFAASDDAVRELLHAADPEFVVVESPEMFDQATPASARLRRVLATDADHYQLIAAVQFGTNHYLFRDSRLLIYRKLIRNPHPDDGRGLPVLGLGRSVGGSGK